MENAANDCPIPPEGDDPPGHGWFQIFGEIWCERCGADYKDPTKKSAFFGMDPRAVRKALKCKLSI